MPPPVVALIGASGFVGLRATEMLSACAEVELVPVVRAPSSLAVLARQPLPWRIAPFLEIAPLARALEGCAVCVHAAIGDAAQIVRMAEVAYQACAAAGVRRLVWLSSASVHGQNCAPGTTETTPLHDRHPLLYNNAKVRAEWALQRLERDGQVEVVRLRPAVVFGPRSRWISAAAEALLAGRAAWIEGGRGVCNSIYIDNLVAAIRLAALQPAIAGRSFLVGDAEPVTWRDFLLPIARHLGFDESAFQDVIAPPIVPERENHLAAFTLSPAYAALGSRIPYRLKRLVKSVGSAWKTPPPPESSWRLRTPLSPVLSVENALLQQCQWRLPSDAARRDLGYQPPIAFAEGLRRSLAWWDSVSA